MAKQRDGLSSFTRILFLAIATAAAAQAEDVWNGVERIVAVGDVHGDYEQFVTILRFAGLVDAQANWTGGKTHLVQTGDLVDRGPQSRRVLDLVMKLESQAARSGGFVHALIGNHEAMNVAGDLRYVSPADFESYESESGQRTLWGPHGKYGKWIRGLNTIIRINDTVFVHGGIGPKYASRSIREINDRIREELNDPAKLQGGWAMDPEGPLWYRGLAEGDEQTLAMHVATVLMNLKAERMVVGHTFTDGAITPRFGGKVLLIDIGLARIYDPLLRQACLVIEKGHPFVLHRGTRLELPTDEGNDMLRYLKAAAALDPPQSSSLRKRIAELESKTQ
jgi:Calcineurin-like phosphoesterase